MANPVFVKTNDNYITALMKVALNAAPGNTYLKQFQAYVAENGGGTAGLQKLGSALANYASTDNAAFAATVVANLGITGDSAAAAKTNVTALLNSYGADRGKALMQLVDVMVNLQGDATWGTAANSFVESVNKAYIYSANTANTTTDLTALVAAASVTTGSGGTGSEAPADYVLTSAQNIITGGSGNDSFRGVAGQAVGNQDQTTLNSSDILDGGNGSDVLVVNMTGPNYIGGARIKNIETLQIGTDVASTTAAPITFDYNVNQGLNEVSGVNNIVYDQINTGEYLTVGNILKTGDEIPTITWDNEAGSNAGAIAVGLRSSAVSGETTLKVVLDDVNARNTVALDGRLDIGGGVEIVRITSQGTTANTLNTSTMTDGTGRADIISASEDGVADNGSLTKVFVSGAQAFGRAATVASQDVAGNTVYGMTNRVASGLTDLGANDAMTGSSNLISVAATVTEIDAAASTGGVAMRFVSRNDGTAVNVKFTGGTGADYIETQAGNANLAGGEGADTFAFINAGLTNFNFGSADTIAGGVGADTVQLGVNGAGTVIANTTEFNNKTGIETLDLRGATNTVTLADAFVAGADVGTFTVRTDKIIQTSDASTANTLPSNATDNRGLENASVNTVVLTELADNRALSFIGGSGSDRVVVDNASANQFTSLDGGSNIGTAATGAAGSNDSLTVVDTSVLDGNDVANIKGFELVNFVETQTANSRFDMTISESFLTNNSTTAKALTLASVTNTYGTALTAADQVFLEVGDLFTTAAATTVKASLAGRVINIGSLPATVTFLVNGSAVAGATARATLVAAGNLATTAADATVLDDVTGATGVGAAAAVALTAGGTFTGTAGLNDTFTGTQASLTGTTVTGTAADVETLTLTDAGTVAIPATVTNIDVLNLANGTNVITAITAAGVTTVNGGTGNDTVTANAAGMTFAGAAGNDTYISAVGGALATTINGGDGVDTLTLANADSLQTSTVTNMETLNITAGATITVGANSLLTQFVNLNASATGSSETINIVAGSHDISNNTVGGFLIEGGQSTTWTVAAGATLTVAGDAQLTAANTIFTGAGTLATTASLTLTDGTDTVSNIRFAAGGATVSLTGGGDAHTITDSTGNDTLSVGSGAANTAAQTVSLANGGSDTILLDRIGTDSGVVTITGFTLGATASGGDVINLNANGIAGNEVMVSATGTNISAANSVAVGNIVNAYVLTGAAFQVGGDLTSTGNGGAVESAVLAAGLSVGADTSTGNAYVILDNGTSTGIYRLAYTDSADADVLLNLASEFTVTLVAQLTGVADTALFNAANLI